MALIKCEECGKEVSEKAVSCPNCGNPIAKEESKVIIYGLSQNMLIGGTLKIYANGEFIGEVKKGQNLEFPIEEDTVITAKCGINPSKGKIEVKPGKTTKIIYQYNRLTGSFIPTVVDTVTNSNNF